MASESPIPDTFRYYLVNVTGEVVAFHRAQKQLELGDVVTVAAGPGAGEWRVLNVLGCQATVAPTPRDVLHASAAASNGAATADD